MWYLTKGPWLVTEVGQGGISLAVNPGDLPLIFKEERTARELAECYSCEAVEAKAMWKVDFGRPLTEVEYWQLRAAQFAETSDRGFAVGEFASYEDAVAALGELSGSVASIACRLV